MLKNYTDRQTLIVTNLACFFVCNFLSTIDANISLSYDKIKSMFYKFSLIIVEHKKRHIFNNNFYFIVLVVKILKSFCNTSIMCYKNKITCKINNLQVLSFKKPFLNATHWYLKKYLFF